MDSCQASLDDVLTLAERSRAGLDICPSGDGVDQRTIQYYGADARQRLSTASTPDWLVAFDRAFAAHDGADGAIYAPQEAALADAFSSLVTPAIRDILRVFEDAPFAADVEAIRRDIADAMYSKLFAMCSGALVLELAAAQSTGLLQGEIAKERFSFFAACLRDPTFAGAILMQYPILVRQATIAVGNWRAALVEFADRLKSDAPQIARSFFAADTTGRLTRLRLSAGDSHRQGRSVIIAEFDHGAHAIVYKPRSLAVDRCFADLVAWFNALGHRLALKSPSILARKDYGWVEHYAAAPCADEREVELFYRRQGANIALVYFLKGTDLHSENIIAAGSQPVLVDLEALFHPTFRAAGERTATSLVQRTIDWSAVATGILPVRPPRATPEDEWLDMSGMSGAQNRQLPFDLPVWVDFDSDEMRMQFERTTLDPDNNLPVLNGERIGPGAYVEAIVAGFTDAYQLLCANRDALLSSDGPLAAFADVEVRVIARNTVRYEQILHDSYHPGFLVKAAAREAFFDTLWSEVEGKPVLAKLHRAERADLWNCDIPVFTTRPSSTVLRTSAGEEIDGAFEDSPWREVINRIKSAGSRDLALQTLLIRASLSEPQYGVARWPLPNHDAAIDAGKKKADPLALANQIGKLLQERAVRTEEGASWIILEESKTGHAATAPASSDLYSGLPGISLFLCALANATGHEQFRTLANEALAELGRLMAVETNANVGGFAGLAGAIYALSQCNRRSGNPALCIAADRLNVPGLFDEIEETDVISGLAGSILSLLAASQRTENPLFRQRAVDAGKILHARMADRLAASQAITDDERAAVFGLGHGPIGGALAFARLGAHTGERRFTGAAAALCEREIARINHWLRACQEDGTDLALSWCNGISGFLAALLEMIDLVPQMHGAATIMRLLDLVLEQGDESNDSLCHGSIGTCLIVAKAAARGFVELAVADTLSQRAMSRIAASGIAGGTVAGLHAPGLMDGLSGIGLGLLGLHAPAATPDVLTLS